MRRDAERWPKIAEAYKRAFTRCIAKRNEDGLETTWKTAEDMYEWWLMGGEGSTEEDPTPWLFE
jgi:hypothetical protein